jgi:hypothetical protein
VAEVRDKINKKSKSNFIIIGMAACFFALQERRLEARGVEPL